MQRRRGRPRSFDEKEVKKTITEVFHRKGYSATSLDDLALATTLTRPSLYGAFGDKQAMFLLAIDTFADDIGKTAGVALQSATSLREALSEFYRKILDLYYRGSDKGARGCLIFATALVDAGTSSEINARLLQKHQEVFKKVAKRVEELSPKATAQQHSAIIEIAVSTLHSLAIRARVGIPRTELETTISHALDVVDLISFPKTVD